MNVFVTGGTGFIGSQLVYRLLKDNYHIKLLCRSAALASYLFGNRVELCEGDLLDVSLLKKAIQGYPIIYHLAGYARNWSKNPAVFFKVNVIGTRNILEAAQELAVQKIVVTSTALTLPPAPGHIPAVETASPLCRSYTLYQQSKILMEKVVSLYAELGLPVVMVNPTRVFGPGRLSEGNSVTRMIQQYLEGKWRMILGSGEAIGNYVYVKDVVEGFLAACRSGQAGERYVLGGENLSFDQFFEQLARISGIKRHMVHVPGKIALSIAAFLKMLARLSEMHPLITPEWIQTFLNSWAVSSDKAIRELGYSITPFPKAVMQTINWLSDLDQKGEVTQYEEYQYDCES